MIEEFPSAIAAAGLTPPAKIHADGKIHRFASNGKPGDDAGWYVLHADHPSAGAFGCWRNGINETWHASNETMGEEERRQLQVRLTTLRKQREAETRRRHAEAAARAAHIWSTATPADASHPYLIKKIVQSYGLRVDQDNRLIVPITIGGKLTSLQFIDPEGNKQYLPGGAVAGGAYVLGDATNATVILTAEGYATGASLYEATGRPVVLAFHAGNLPAAAHAIHANHPTARIVICADHDRNNVGQVKAKEASAMVDGLVAIPATPGMDFNDLAQTEGLAKVRELIDTTIDAADAMEVTGLAGSFQVRFAANHVTMYFHRVSENTRGVHAELTVSCNQVKLLGDTDIGLKSDSSRDKLAKSLTRTSPAISWKSLLDRACTAVLNRFRDGDPIEELQPSDSVHVPFVLNPIVYRNHQTLIFAPGGSFKSYLALYLALVVIAGLRQGNVSAVRTNVLFMDWELDAETVGARLKALQAGHPELAHVRPFYRRCAPPLHLDAPQIAAEVARLDVGLVIVDSAAMACGGDLNSPESAIKLQQALRRIGCASIVLAHVSKSTADGQEKSAYGSVFFRELARNVWELSRPENSPRVVLSQTGSSCKNSFGPKQDPLGFEFAFASDRVTITAFNPADEEDSGFEEKLPARQRIIRLLTDGVRRESQVIAEALQISARTVASELSRGKKDGVFDRSGPYQGGKWGLKKSLQPIVAAQNRCTSLQSLQTPNGNRQPLDIPSGKIVAPIVDDRCTESLLQVGGIYIPPAATISATTPTPPVEEVIDL